MSQGQLWSMMISRVPPPALPDLRPAVQLACPARPLVRIQECRAAGAAARGRCAAPNPSPAAAGLGRPRDPCRTYPAPAMELEGAPGGHARHCPAVAPPTGHRWSPGSGPTRTGQAGRRSAPRSPHSSSAWLSRTLRGATSESRASCSSSATGSAHPQSAGFSRRCGSRRRRSGIPTRPGGSSCTRKPRQCVRRISFTSTAR